MSRRVAARAGSSVVAAAIVALTAILAAPGCARRPAATGAGPGQAGRWAVLAPAAAEALVALGAGERIVAVGDWITWPADLARLPRLGSYDAPSEEALVALGVDTLVTTESVAGRESRERLGRLGIRVVELDTSTLDGALDAVRELGVLCARRDRAEALVAAVRQGLESTRLRVASLERRTVLVVVGREPLFVAGPGSHLDQLVQIAGGSNVVADLGSTYGQVSLEAILARRPEVIVDLSDNRAGAARGRQAGGWQRWPFLPAVEADRVWLVDPMRLSIPGIRMAEMAETMARLIHPEELGAPAPEALESATAVAPPVGEAAGESAAPR